MTLTGILSIIDEETLKTIGVHFNPEDVCLADLKDSYYTLGRVDISPAMCGPVGAMFSSINCQVQVGYVECKSDPAKTPQLHFRFTYDYNHSDGGHNGYTVRKVRDVK